jgi:predicted nucleic-acid-binding protein
MRAVDTNLLVRLLTRDDVKQAQAADRFVAPGAWVPTLALTEAVWVLSTVYEREPPQITAAVEMLLNHAHLTLQDPDIVNEALQQFKRRPSVGFSDCILLETARKAGHLPMGTFDAALARLEGAERVG